MTLTKDIIRTSMNIIYQLFCIIPIFGQVITDGDEPFFSWHNILSITFLFSLLFWYFAKDMTPFSFDQLARNWVSWKKVHFLQKVCHLLMQLPWSCYNSLSRVATTFLVLQLPLPCWKHLHRSTLVGDNLETNEFTFESPSLFLYRDGIIWTGDFWNDVSWEYGTNNRIFR